MANWIELFDAIHHCEKCDLRATRNYAVPGEGNPHASLMFIGEGPGADEDAQGRPFVGASGQLLTEMLKNIGVSRRDIYIANIVKCRPPHNRTPDPAEAAACMPYLREQFKLIRPKMMVLLGGTAAKYILGGDIRIRRDHGVWIERKGIWMMPTYHPSALLRDESQRPDADADFLSIRQKMEELGL